MATVISNDDIERHNVNTYNFKVIAFGAKDEEIKEEATVSVEPQLADETIDSSALSSGTKDSLIESLMKKTDEMTSNFIKLQMKLEEKEAEFSENLQKAKEEAYQEGLEAGVKHAQEGLEKSVQNSIELYAASVQKLEESANEFKSSIESLKSELVLAALDVAKEVVKVEVSENSSEIAKVLSEELIKDLQGASKITLKVNPKDHSVISQHLGNLENITIVSDSAISEGGVIVLSDAGNIDAQIQKRFERVKKAALSE
ncbi:flagellar assembly protein FliH [Sulfurimonas sp. C5]|uniref:flagellar assembly protein FliH n=1 Tax=Sulfurimonas sp. C5 TaxID=3036947 RepID=UPI0024556240|nr:flagellar assembly protein FliH [Sulfurimonas sp. C5]MDH4945138.1 flagellar assembly protein FliH [Sulfurimonas sp. C5]